MFWLLWFVFYETYASDVGRETSKVTKLAAEVITRQEDGIRSDGIF